jgi:hypothetical protein
MLRDLRPIGGTTYHNVNRHEKINLLEMLLNGFSGFPKLSHVMNLHLQDYTVLRSMFKALQEVVSKQDAKISFLQTSMNKALTKLHKS